MSPSELVALGYPGNIDQLIKECDGVELIEENDHYYLIHDDYNEDDRVLHINKEPGFKEEYFQFFNNEVNKEAIFSFAKTLPPLLFMNLRKVFFVEKEADLTGEVEEESPNHTFSFSDDRKTIGMAVYRDSIAFVNLAELKNLAEDEEKDDIEILRYSKGCEQIFIDAVCQTLAHELFHLLQFNPLIEELIPAGEEPAEEFCRYYS